MNDLAARGIKAAVEEPQWNSKPAWKLPGWAEPLVSFL